MKCKKNNHKFLLWFSFFNNTKDEEGTIHCLTVVRMSDTDSQRTVLLCFSIKPVLKCSVLSLVKAWVWRTRPWLWGSPNVSSSCSKAVVLNHFLSSAHVNARHVNEDQTRESRWADTGLDRATIDERRPDLWLSSIIAEWCRPCLTRNSGYNQYH